MGLVEIGPDETIDARPAQAQLRGFEPLGSLERNLARREAASATRAPEEQRR
jgi:hypothetical protein